MFFNEHESHGLNEWLINFVDFSTAWHSKQASSAHALIEKFRKHLKTHYFTKIVFSKHTILQFYTHVKRIILHMEL